MPRSAPPAPSSSAHHGDAFAPAHAPEKLTEYNFRRAAGAPLPADVLQRAHGRLRGPAIRIRSRPGHLGSGAPKIFKIGRKRSCGRPPSPRSRGFRGSHHTEMFRVTGSSRPPAPAQSPARCPRCGVLGLRGPRTRYPEVPMPSRSLSYCRAFSSSAVPFPSCNEVRRRQSRSVVRRRRADAGPRPRSVRRAAPNQARSTRTAAAEPGFCGSDAPSTA